MSTTSSLPGDSDLLTFDISPDHFVSLVEQLRDTQSSAPLDEIGGISEVIRGLQTDPVSGLGQSEISESFRSRKNHFGDNQIPQPPATPFWRIFLESFKDPMLIILIIMSVISVVLEVGVPLVKTLQNPNTDTDGGISQAGDLPWYFGWIEGFSIFSAVGIVVIVGSVNDYSKELKFRELAAEGDRIRVSVIRDNLPCDIWVDEIVTGDVICLNTGDKVPADGILVSCYDLAVKEGAVTGEAEDVQKSSENPVVLSGTEVTMGTGRFIVVCVGEYSEWGKTMKAVTDKDRQREKTPLETKLDSLAAKVGYLGFGFAFATLIVLCIGYVIQKFFPNTWTTSFTEPAACVNFTTMTTAEKEQVHYCGAIGTDLSQIVEFIIIAVTIVVVAVPEGLPLAVTISLAYSVKQMLRDKNLVRHLAACETMGGCNTICSDKTGTLTQNEMRVTHTWIAGRLFGEGESPTFAEIDPFVQSLLMDSISCNSTANLVVKDESEIDVSKSRRTQLKVQGSRTEGALLYFLNITLQQDYMTLRDEYYLSNRTLKKFSFSSKLKRMSCVLHVINNDIQVDDQSGGRGRGRVILPPSDDIDIDASDVVRLFCKGASEIILQLCTHYVNSQGRVSFMDDGFRREMEDQIDTWACQGLRTLSLAYRDLGIDEKSLDVDDYDRELMECDLTLYQIVGISDPLRPEVVEAMQKCKTAGILVRMVTGDNLNTAKHIAGNAGIFSEEDLSRGLIAMEGPEFRKLSDEQLEKIVPKLRILARSSPMDKLRLVKFLKNGPDVVAVTGDGTNDGPALHAADVGLSMGLSGTQVAKAASDIVILDDNFASIVSAVIWGRSIYENIRKFLQFQLSVNVVALVMTIVAAITQFIPMEDAEGNEFHSDVPLTAIQLLWVNLIMDTLAALALATEKPVPELLNRKPYSKTESLINWKMWVSILVQSVYQLVVLCFLYYGGVYIWPLQVLTYGERKTARWTGSTYEFIPENAVYRPWVKNTLVFNTFVFMQIFNELNCRRINLEWNIFGNPCGSLPFILIFVVTCVIQIGIVEIGAWSGGNMVFQTTGQEPWALGIAVAFGAGSIIIQFAKTAVLRLLLLCIRRSSEEVEVPTRRKSPRFSTSTAEAALLSDPKEDGFVEGGLGDEEEALEMVDVDGQD